MKIYLDKVELHFILKYTFIFDFKNYNEIKNIFKVKENEDPWYTIKFLPYVPVSYLLINFIRSPFIKDYEVYEVLEIYKKMASELHFCILQINSTDKNISNISKFFIKTIHKINTRN